MRRTKCDAQSVMRHSMWNQQVDERNDDRRTNNGVNLMIEANSDKQWMKNSLNHGDDSTQAMRQEITDVDLFKILIGDRRW